MIEKINLQNTAPAKFGVSQKTDGKTGSEANETLTRKSNAADELNDRRHFDDAAEMFHGLFGGNEHYDGRDSSFVSLFG